MVAPLDATEVFAALAEPNRVAIAELLAESGPMRAGGIAERFEISASAISQHLRILRQAGVVTVRKEGQRRIYELNEGTIGSVGEWIDALRDRLQRRYDTLEKLLQQEEGNG